VTRLILRALNGPALVLLVAIGVAIQTSLFATYPLMYMQPDVVLLATLWCALRRSFYEGGILTLIFSRIAEIHSASPQGLMMICYILVFFGIRGAARALVIPGLQHWVILTLVSSVAWKLASLGVLHLMGLSGNQWRHTLSLLFPGALMEGAAAYFAYRWLERFDWVTYRNEKARQAVEEQLRMYGEGL
jgi:hypothetical protein